MQKIISKFTVYFDAPFWVGVYERLQGEQYQVCKVTFGAAGLEAATGIGKNKEKE